MDDASDDKKRGNAKANTAQPVGGGPGNPLGARDFYLKQRGLTDDGFLPDYARRQQPEHAESRQEAAMSPAKKARKTSKSTRSARGPKRVAPTVADDETVMAENARAGSMGATSKAAERFLARMAPALVGASDLEGAMAPALTLSITGVSTNSQAGSQNSFLLNSDALALVINISVSQDIINAGNHFTAHFQIIEFSTNNVKADVATANSAFSWGPNFWISRGNNWGPAASDYTTPAKWGLAAGLYSFRATVEVLGIGTFAVSQELPFRVR